MASVVIVKGMVLRTSTASPEPIASSAWAAATGSRSKYFSTMGTSALFFTMGIIITLYPAREYNKFKKRKKTTPFLEDGAVFDRLCANASLEILARCVVHRVIRHILARITVLDL